MARKYKRLTYADRKEIEAMCKSGMKVKEISEKIGAHRATIYHELQRGSVAKANVGRKYNADTAQKTVGGLYEKV